MKKRVLDLLHPEEPKEDHTVTPFMDSLLEKIVSESEPLADEAHPIAHINENDTVYIIPLTEDCSNAV